MTDNNNDPKLISGQESLRVFEGLNRGMSRRSALQMLGVAGVAAAGTGSLFSAAGKLFAPDSPVLSCAVAGGAASAVERHAVLASRAQPRAHPSSPAT